MQRRKLDAIARNFCQPEFFELACLPAGLLRALKAVAYVGVKAKRAAQRAASGKPVRRFVKRGRTTKSAVLRAT